MGCGSAALCNGSRGGGPGGWWGLDLGEEGEFETFFNVFLEEGRDGK